ncbi:MAG: S9 family peptidase [Prolixibacteraceae bacterium]|nr:S9 family peptidase [Prolixibacteraceae bacterium]MBN2774802.1 S9 family peptidase [Prolixibacteraceae bacterium]
MKRIFLIITASLFIIFISGAQETVSLESLDQKFTNENENLTHQFDQLLKSIDDILWYNKVGDIAHVDKLYIYGPLKWKEENPTGKGAGNPVKFWTYAFIPLNIDVTKKYPLIVLPHGGVHSDFTTYYSHIVRELVSQGYVIVAPEYRGSTGYGRSHYEKIDYGGLETEDVYYSRNYMIENYGFIDKERIGIIGWSHGGLITLMNIFDHPDDYQVAFAGVPVSDLIARMGYYDESYRDLYEAEYHIGKSASEDVAEYRRRSPAWNTHKFQGTPLLIHTNTNDEDVNVLEVEHLIKSLKVEGKKFDYEIFDNIPGGHSFDRMDTKTAKEIRLKIYKHLSKYLNPSNPFENFKDLQKAGYKF